MRPTIPHTTRAPREPRGPSVALMSAEPERTAAGSASAAPALVYDETAPEPLNLAERLAARVGAWVGALAERWGPGCGPFFAADGQIAVSSAIFAPEPTRDAPTTAQ